MSKIKVLHIIKSLGRGGAEMLLPETIALHNPDQFDFSVAYFLPWKDQLVKEIEATGAKVHCFNKTNNLTILASVNIVTQYVKDNQIDLIHAHLPWAGILARLVGKKIEVPVIYTEHNRQERYHFTTKWMNKLTFNLLEVAIAVSEDVAASIQKNINPTITVQTILNGVNTYKFHSGQQVIADLKSDFNIPPNSIIMGTVAVFRTQKRLEKWIELAAHMKAKLPEVHFVMLGDGPEEEKIKNKMASVGLVDHVTMPGRLEEVRPWLEIMDFYMMTSEFEGLPIALLEAMSMQLPIISTDAGGIKEVIRNEEEGYLVPVNEPEKLLAPALELANDQTKRRIMGEKARRRVEEAFSLERMVTELEQVYHKVLAVQ